MAVDSYDSTTGRPIFLDTGAPDIGVDPTKVGEYAADVGNRIVRANLAALDAYPYKRAGLRGYALDTNTEYTHSGSGWVQGDGIGGGMFAAASGFTYVSVTTGVTVNFPASRFSQAPLVVATPQNSSTVVVPHITSLTASSFLLRLYTLSNVATTGNVSWAAFQKTPTSVGG